MNKIYKILTLGVVCTAVIAGTTMAHPGGKRPAPSQKGVERPLPPNNDGERPIPPEGCEEMHHHGSVTHGRHMQDPVTFQSNKICYVPAMHAYIAIDSIDCAIDLVVREGNEMKLVGRHVTDSLYKRHDLNNIHRPRSVWVLGDKILYLASSAKDSAHLGILSMHPDNEGNLHFADENSYIGLSFNAYAFDVNTESRELTVVGTNPQGYSVEIFDISNFPDKMVVKGNPYNYRKKKQAEVIKESDPYGVGLTVVAVSVVFIALICVCLIMLGYGSSIRSITERKKRKADALKSGITAEKPATVATTTENKVDGDVYAAIATAIYLYNEELHDDEDMVLTIQNVERAWTPWNAKVYNMNQYFNNRK